MHQRRSEVALLSEKMAEYHLGWYIQRKLCKRLHQFVGSPIIGCRVRPRKPVGSTIKKNLDLNKKISQVIYNNTLWYHFIHRANPTQVEKAFCCCKAFSFLNQSSHVMCLSSMLHQFALYTVGWLTWQVFLGQLAPLNNRLCQLLIKILKCSPCIYLLDLLLITAYE